MELEKYTIVGEKNVNEVADILYNSPEYFNVLCVLNNIVNPFEDWLLKSSQVEYIAKSRYSDINDVHHYVDEKGRVYFDLILEQGYYYDKGDISFTYPIKGFSELQPVSNIEHEYNENDKKRVITIVAPNDLQEWLKQNG
jgi:hypothetical protein